MTPTTPTARVDSLFRFLEQRVETMETFHIANHRLVLADFCDYFERDDVVGLLAKALGRRGRSPKRWYQDSLKASAAEPLPEDPVQAFATRFELMKHVRMEKTDLKYFVANVFAGSHLNALLMEWKRIVVHPFAADCRAFSQALRERLPDDEWVDLPTLIDDVLAGPFPARAFGPRPWTDADDARVEAEEEAAKQAKRKPQPASQPAAETPQPAPEPPEAASPPAPDPLATALYDLYQGVLALPEGVERDDHLWDIEILRLELERPERLPQRIERTLRRLEPRTGLEAGVAAFRAAL